jgi:hypothetical protein
MFLSFEESPNICLDILGFACLSDWVWKFVPNVVFWQWQLQKIEIWSWQSKKGFGRFDWGVGEVLLLCFFVYRELVVALK